MRVFHLRSAQRYTEEGNGMSALYSMPLRSAHIRHAGQTTSGVSDGRLYGRVSIRVSVVSEG